jgi:diguanylate cyclase (GGDEF)-like protein
MSQALQDFLEQLAAAAPGWQWQIATHALPPQTWQAGVAQSDDDDSSMTAWGLNSGEKLVGRLHARGAKDTSLSPATLALVMAAKPLLGELLALQGKLSQVEDQATHDALTGLLNRRGWETALAAEESRCRRHERAAVIVALDLDRLKQRNDAEGHAAGDELLQKTADCLRRAIRAQDIAARLGGDEFGILLVECAGECVPLILERLRKSLAATGVEATLGWAARDKACDLHATWQAADQTLIASKHK